MHGKSIEIDGVTFNLDDPDEKRAAVRAWLKAKSRERRAQEPLGNTAADSEPASEGADETGTPAEND
jgi:hypothetical protein